MATANPFDLLGDDDAEDPSLLIAAQKQKSEPKKPVSQSRPASASAAAAAGVKQVQSQGKGTPQAKLPSKPLPPDQAVREARSESDKGGRGYGRGRGTGGGFYRELSQSGAGEIPPHQGWSNEGDAERRGGYSGPRAPFRGGRRGGFSGNGEVFEGERERPNRSFERRSGTGRGNEMKREGSGRGNWGSQGDEVAHIVEEGDTGEVAKKTAEKPAGEDPSVVDGDKEAIKINPEEKAPEEMTLEEYQKVLEEKRKALLALKTEERKVDVKEFESMQQLSNKKTNDHIFIKLGSEKDKKKELADKEERSKKSVSINEFLKPATGENYYTPGARGRGRGRGPRGGGGGGYNSSGSMRSHNVQAPLIEDPGEFPTLGVK